MTNVMSYLMWTLPNLSLSDCCGAGLEDDVKDYNDEVSLDELPRHDDVESDALSI